jgi:hypothetical protein
MDNVISFPIRQRHEGVDVTIAIFKAVRDQRRNDASMLVARQCSSPSRDV